MAWDAKNRQQQTATTAVAVVARRSCTVAQAGGTRGGRGNKANSDHASATACSPVPMSFSDTIKKAKVAAAATAEANKVRDEGGQQAQATTFQPSKTQQVVPRRDNEMGGEAHMASERHAEGEEDEEVELRMPGSFDFENHDSGAARAGVPSIHSMWSACLGTCGGGCR